MHKFAMNRQLEERDRAIQEKIRIAVVLAIILCLIWTAFEPAREANRKAADRVQAQYEAAKQDCFKDEPGADDYETCILNWVDDHIADAETHNGLW